MIEKYKTVSSSFAISEINLFQFDTYSDVDFPKPFVNIIWSPLSGSSSTASVFVELQNENNKVNKTKKLIFSFDYFFQIFKIFFPNVF